MRLGQALTSQTPTEYHERVKGLYKEPETSSGSKSVAGVGISFTGKLNKDGSEKIIIRVKREPKIVTEGEIRLLAEEYGRSFDELHRLFQEKKRKINVRKEGKK